MAVDALVEERHFYPLLAKLQECLCTELSAAGGPALCFCGVMIGDTAPLSLMDCSTNCGVAWVRPMAIFPTLTFPLAADPSQTITCDAPRAMMIEVGVARCAPRAQGHDLYPDPQSTFDALRLYMSDSDAILRAIKCCLGANRSVDYALGQWSPIPVMGGVSGGMWQVTVG